MDKHYLCSEGNKNATFRWHYLFLGEWYFFVTILNHQTLQKTGVSAGTRKNPEWHFWLQKCHFGKGPRKGFFTICDTQKLCSAENTIFIVFSANTALQKEKCASWKEKFTENLGLFANMPKVFFWSFLLFGGSLLLCSLFLFLISGKSPKQALFLQF